MIPPGLKSRNPFKFLSEFRKDPVAFLKRLSELGPVAQINAAGTPIVLVSGPGLVKEVLVAKAGQLHKAKAVERAKRLLGEGLFTSEGALHARQRRLVMPAFHRQRIAGYAQVMAERAGDLAAGLKEGETLALWDAMMSLSLDISARTLFGADLEAEAPRIRKAMAVLVDRFEVAALPLWDWIAWRLPLPATLAMRRAMRELDDVVLGILKRRRESPSGHQDLLQMLMEAQDEDAGGARMSDTQVRDEAMTILLASHETAGGAMTWTWLALMQNPEAYARLREEAKSVLQGRLPTAEDYPRLPYCQMAFAEGMRLYSPAWIMGRLATEPMQLGGFDIAEGSVILFSPYWAHRDPLYWDDPESFRPERFSPEAKAARLPFTYFPFGGGPRGCIGEGFAWMEGVLVLSTLAQAWRFELKPGHPKVELLPKFVLRPSREIEVKVT